MHDGTLDRTTNGEGKTADQTAETIKKYVVDGNTSAPTAPIPLLKDYFEEFKGTGEVLVVELKSSDTKIGEPLAKLIKEYGMERQVVTIAFNKDMIASIRRADPDISVNFLTSGITANESRSLEVAGEVLSNVIPINTAYSPSQAAGTLGPNLYTDLAVRGVTLWNWTVNDKDKFNSYFISGIRGITTNYSQWAGDYVEDFSMTLSTDGVIELNAVTYKGRSSNTKSAELVVIGGTGTYENGIVTLSEDAEGFFFRLKKSLSSGTSYYVVTPVMLREDYHVASPAPETTEEVTTEAPDLTEPETDTVTEPVTEPVVEENKGCGGMISLCLIALIPAAVLIVRKKED
jgi:glycerophosphoryl diester phosphodiesterase